MHYLLHYQQPFYSNARDLSEFSKAWCCQSTPGATPSSVVSFPACSVFSQGSQQMVELNILPPDLISVSSMGQHLGKREAPTDSKPIRGGQNGTAAALQRHRSEAPPLTVH
ncbi:hypothetical protein NQZ68_013313 [Dissostichus eleginoides]|nr:hypothetical protein NQZ68_013313 [Dissostichus eleginoides]